MVLQESSRFLEKMVMIFILMFLVLVLFIALNGVEKAKEECQKVNNVQECVLVAIPKEVQK